VPGGLPKTAHMSIRRHIRRCRAAYSFAAAFVLALAVTGSAPAGSGSVSVTSVGLAGGGTLSGSVAWTASISGNPNRVDFAVDGAVRWTDQVSPYTFNGDGNMLDTSALADGSHTFTVTAYPTPGRGQSVSASVTAVVSNVAASQPPASTSVPTITGVATVGQTLTASNGSWTGTTPMSYSYQWKSCDVTGATCTLVVGATASTFLVPTSGAGSTFRVAVTASNAAGSAVASSAATSVVASDVPSTAPSSAALPAITGTPISGQTLTASQGTWAGTTPMSYTYQWQLCSSTGSGCSAIAGATSPSYVLGSADVGGAIRVTVTASNSIGSASASSAATAAVTSASPPLTAPLATTLPSIGGTAAVGQTLSASSGTWAGTNPMSYAYQWQKCNATGGSCSPIANAASSSYTIASTLAGSTVRVSVTASNSVASATASSDATGAVASSPSGAPSFESQTAYLNTVEPDLSKATVISSASQFVTAMASAAAGQTYDVLGTVKIPGEFTGWNRVVAGGVVNVVFEPGAGFTGGAGAQLPAVWIKGSGGWHIWGGTLSNPDGGGILVYAMPGPFTWTGFSSGQTATTGVSVLPVGGNVSNLTLAGVSGSSSENLAFDPHLEKGTGLHGWNLADATGGIVQNSTFACDVLNQATGAGVEIETDRVSNVVVYARAVNLGFPLPGTTWTGDAKSQVAGNVIQLWGGSAPGKLDIRYAEGNDIQGRIVETNGVASGADLSQVDVAYGRATGPILQNSLLSKVAYSVKGGLKLGDVLPLP
jgi:hypothetical protein